MKKFSTATPYISAFSLIELSIVILVIGILVAGVVQGSKLYDKFKVQTAIQLTQSSPVNGIKNLALWFETSTAKSFNQSDIDDDGKISTWHNINPQSNFFKNASVTLNANGYDCGTSSSPFYEENLVNGLPMIRFKGNQCINFDGSVLNNTDFTIFTVGKILSTSNGWHFFISGRATGTSQNNISIGYRSGISVIYFWNYQNSEIYATDLISSAFSSGQNRPLIVSAWYSKTLGKKLWINGGVNPADSNASQTESIFNYVGATMGMFVGNYAPDLDMAELIIFQKALNNEERMAVEKYLGQKYNIRTN